MADLDERSFQPGPDAAVRVDPTYCVLWGFPVGGAELLPAYGPLLDEVADLLTLVDPVAAVDVAGHASASGTEARNLTLSEARAAAVRDALEERGVDAGRIRCWGEGEQRPWLGDGSPEALARNRRVEVVVRAVLGVSTAPDTVPDTEPADEPADEPPPATWPPSVPVRELFDPPPGPEGDLLRRIRDLAGGLSDELIDLLEADLENGVLRIAGWTLAAIAIGVGVFKLIPAFVAIVGPRVAAEIVREWATLQALDDAIAELADATRPPESYPEPQDAGVPPVAGVPMPGEDIWAQPEFTRGRAIQDALASTDYAGWLQTDDLEGFENARNFPLIDFVSPDHDHSVSVKTYNPFAGRYASGDTLYDVVAHADELAAHAPEGRVTLDVRVPPGTPEHVMQELRDTLYGQVGGRLEVQVEIWPR